MMTKRMNEEMAKKGVEAMALRNSMKGLIALPPVRCKCGMFHDEED
jgi:hypothetical protein